jgi:hypothetical protein
MPAASTVETRLVFPCAPAQAWETLLFYEQLEEAPPLHLRLLLPVPVGTSGGKSRPGDEARCLYRGGHLIKRVTAVEPCRSYFFEVVEQELRVGGGIRLLGGAYSLRELAADATEVSAVTRYQSPLRPRWLWQPLEALVCHAFHRHILGAMRRGVRRLE